MEAKKFNTYFRLLLIGKSGVGKTSILRRYIGENEIPSEHYPNISIDCRTRPYSIGDHPIEFKVSLLDPPGDPSYNELVKIYWDRVDLFIFVVSITDRQSLTYIEEKYKEIENLQIKTDKILLVNKTDLQEHVQLTSGEIDNFVSRCGVKNYYECSAFSNMNITEAIGSCMKPIVENVIKAAAEETKETKRRDKELNKKECKCAII